MAGTVLRFALLGFAAALSEHYSEDATVFVQLRTDDADLEEEEELWEERSFLPASAEHYAADTYTFGEMAEGRAKDGSWLPVFITGHGQGNPNSWNIHVADNYPGYDLPNVPAHLVRKRLAPGQSDWHVDNSVLQHNGLGVKFRSTKDMHDRKSEFAPWGDLVVGTDEGDGWVKTSSGYLPKIVHNATVLVRQERRGKVAAMPHRFIKDVEEIAKKQQQAAEEQEKIKKAKEAKEALNIPYVVGELVQMKTKSGSWYSGRISALSKVPNKYDVLVQVDPTSVHSVNNIPAERIRKVPGGAPHIPMPNESPMCQRDGCFTVHAVPENGEEMLLHLSRHMGASMMMKMACNRLRIEWDDCLGRTTFTYKGSKIAAASHISEVGLQEGDTVKVSVAPPSENSSSSLLEDA